MKRRFPGARPGRRGKSRTEWPHAVPMLIREPRLRLRRCTGGEPVADALLPWRPGRRGPAGVFGSRAHSGPDPVGFGVAEMLENRQRALPGAVGGRGISEGLVRVAEEDEALGFAVPVAELAEPADGLLVAGGGLLPVAEVAMEI